jgi:hypothetical protein
VSEPMDWRKAKEKVIEHYPSCFWGPQTNRILSFSGTELGRGEDMFSAWINAYKNLPKSWREGKVPSSAPPEASQRETK